MIRFGLEFIRLDSMRMIGRRISLEHFMAVALLLFGLMILTEQLKKYRITVKERPKNLKVIKKNK